MRVCVCERESEIDKQLKGDSRRNDELARREEE